MRFFKNILRGYIDTLMIAVRKGWWDIRFIFCSMMIAEPEVMQSFKYAKKLL